MKKILLLLIAVLIPCMAQATPILQASEYVSFGLREPLDSLYGIPRKPDSAHIITRWANGTTVAFTTRSTTFPFSAIGIDTSKNYSDTAYHFSDQVQDIDGAAQHGLLNIDVVLFYDKIPTHNFYSVYIISDSLENMLDASKDSSSSAAVLSQQIRDYMDSLVYYGAVWIDDGAGNTNTAIGTDGTEKNPVSTLTAAKTIADALGIQRYHIVNASSLTLAATHEGWMFIGLGHNNLLNLGSQDVDNSNFIGLGMTGTQGGTGTIGLLYCDINILRDFDGHAQNSWLVDSLVMDNNSEAFLGNCYSAVAGNATPTLDFNVAANNVSMRNYSGGINVVGMSSNDNLSLEGQGQLVIDASATSAPITVRGNFTITDNGTTTALTRDAALNGEYLTDLTWDEPLSGSEHNDGGSSGQRLRLLEQNTIIRAETAQGPYGASNRIQLDAGASALDGSYDPAGVSIVGGTGAGQTRTILQYDGTNKVAVVDRDWKITPDATSEFIVYSDPGREHVNEGEAQGGSANTVTLNTLASSNDNVYNGQIVFLRGGTGQDQMRQAIGYNGTTKVLTVASDWDVNPDTSTSYVMYPFQFNQATDADSALFSRLIKRAGWGIPQGSGDDSSTIAQRTVTPSDVNINGDTVATSGTDQILRLRGLYVRATGTNDTAAIFAGNGTGHGFATLSGSGITGNGFHSVSLATNGDGTFTQGSGNRHGMHSVGGATGHGIRGFSSGASTYGIIGQSSGAGGVGIFGDGPGSSGFGMRAEGGAIGFSITGTTIGLEVAEATPTASFNAVVLTPGSAGIALLADGGDSGIVANGTDVDVYANTGSWPGAAGGGGADSGTVSRIVARSWGQARGAGDDSLTTAQRVIGSNATEQGGIAGATLALRIYVTDTSGVDDTLDAAFLTIQNATGVQKLVGITNSAGYFEDNVTAGWWRLLGSKYGYAIDLDSFNVTTNDTVELRGYDVAINAPSNPTLCRVYSYIARGDLYRPDGIEVRATRVGSLNATDTSSGYIIIKALPPAYTDTLGYWFMDLLTTGDHDDSSQGFYNFEATYLDQPVFKATKVWITGGTVRLDTVIAKGNNR